ncbi:DUF1365 domain-containing protein [Roseicitreum antarcticum]|uniref:Cyclopropane-fatty-acyl-phospholipid synthase n=1 Tax=Roseicitreum antarcticum TaxID=564137 RepID=A0A1H3AN51_9RHOB|nr:DUF1365 domain-containing protein [Roseicitreum antarcticum]SDX30584.1 hypothetical protein SAMN04488238_10750 [Roseicitreum antarcticum]
MSVLDHIAGQTFHGRRGGIGNRFTYGVDYLLFDPEAALSTPALLSRNRANIVSLHDSDHGGDRGAGRGAPWVREVLAAHGLTHATDGQLLLLAQPRVLGHVFNPVSFWLCHDTGGALRAVIAEVNNTFGDRHSYLCHHDDLRPIGPQDRLGAAKVFHVSPFQPVAGDYTFRFDITADRVGIWIEYGQDAGGLIATLTGKRVALTNGGLLFALLRRPFGSRRVLGLIHWQALKLWWRGAKYHPRPEPPADPVSK